MTCSHLLFGNLNFLDRILIENSLIWNLPAEDTDAVEAGAGALEGTIHGHGHVLRGQRIPRIISHSFYLFSPCVNKLPKKNGSLADTEEAGQDIECHYLAIVISF